MKILEEVIKEYAIECGNPFGINLVAVDIEGCKIIANRFAKEVAKEALKNASENARLYDDVSLLKEIQYIDEMVYDVGVTIDKQSILNESNIPKL